MLECTLWTIGVPVVSCLPPSASSVSTRRLLLKPLQHLGFGGLGTGASYSTGQAEGGTPIPEQVEIQTRPLPAWPHSTRLVTLLTG